MRNCRVVITVSNDVVNIEGEDISVEELATLSGFLQVFVGTEGLKRGLDIDDVKDNMLDIHFAAMETVGELMRAAEDAR